MTIRKCILGALLGVALAFSTASPALAVGVPFSPPPVEVAVGAAVGRQEFWHQLVETRVNFFLDREILYRLSIGHDVIDGRVSVTQRSHESIHLTAWFLAVNNRGEAYFGYKRCNATRTFGGGDFPQPRRVYCSPEPPHEWAPR